MTSSLDQLTFKTPTIAVDLMRESKQETSGSIAPVPGFARADRVSFTVAVRSLNAVPSADNTISVKIENSTDGNTWTTLATFGPYKPGNYWEEAHATDPGDLVRVSWQVAGKPGWYVTAAAVCETEVVPTTIGQGGGGGGPGPIIPSVVVPITPAEFAALETTPKVLVPASPGKAVVPFSAGMLLDLETPFSGQTVLGIQSGTNVWTEQTIYASSAGPTVIWFNFEGALSVPAGQAQQAVVLTLSQSGQPGSLGPDGALAYVFYGEI